MGSYQYSFGAHHIAPTQASFCVLEGGILLSELGFRLGLLSSFVVGSGSRAKYFVDGPHQGSSLVVDGVAEVILSDAQEIINKNVYVQNRALAEPSPVREISCPLYGSGL
jgi:hypothetical protein